MILSAHRCGTDRYPELTLSAAKHSLSAGAHSVEMDIRFTKDNVAVISHDKDTARSFGADQNICDLTADQFKTLCYLEDPNFHPHTLDEVMESGVSPILFHVKEGAERLTAILQTLQEHHYLDKVIMGLATPEDVRLVKAYSKDIQVLAFMPTPEAAADFIDAGAEIIRYWEKWVSEESVRMVHAAGRRYWVMAGDSKERTTGYTSPENISYWKRIGVDGLLINEIEKTRSLI